MEASCFEIGAEAQGTLLSPPKKTPGVAQGLEHQFVVVCPGDTWCRALRGPAWDHQPLFLLTSILSVDPQDVPPAPPSPASSEFPRRFLSGIPPLCLPSPPRSGS